MVREASLRKLVFGHWFEWGDGTCKYLERSVHSRRNTHWKPPWPAPIILMRLVELIYRRGGGSEDGQKTGDGDSADHAWCFEVFEFYSMLNTKYCNISGKWVTVSCIYFKMTLWLLCWRETRETDTKRPLTRQCNNPPYYQFEPGWDMVKSDWIIDVFLKLN